MMSRRLLDNSGSLADKNTGRAFEMLNGRRTPLKQNSESVIPELLYTSLNIIVLVEETRFSY